MATFYRWHIGPGQDGSFGKYAQIETTINLLVLIDGVRVREQTGRPHQAKEHDMRAFARGSVAHLSLSFWANMFSVQLNCCHKMPLLWCVIADALSTKQNTANPHTVLCGIQTHVRAQCTLHSVHSAHTNITTKQRTQLKTNATNYFNEAQFFPLLCASTSAF